MRTLPKDHRRALGPASDVAKRAAREIEHDRERKPFVDAVADALTKLTGVGVPRELWRPDQLPDQFRMNIRVIDDRGEPIAESRDLPRLKRELRSRMRASFETLSDDRWTRDGITDWDFGQLPEQVQLRRGDVDVNVFPALVDDARSVKLRLFETKAAADRAHRRGLRRLFDLRASEELRSHAAYMPGFDEIALHYAPLGSPEELRGHLRLMLADRLFVGTGGAVRTQRDFDARLDAGWHRIGEVAHGVCDLALEVLKWRTAVSRLVDEPPRHVSPHAIDDLRAQLTHLTTPGFLSSTPIEQLRHYPRYLKAMELRIDRAGRDRGKRDDELMARVLPHWRQYMQVLAQRPDAREASAEFDELGWMIEEFRVQLFAQELRTATPVSDKRLREQWPKCKL
jgi:ATP-dependent helicase HrpA